MVLVATGSSGCGGTIVRNDVLPLAGIGARHHSYHRLGLAQVEHFVRHAGLDEDEVAGTVLE